MSVLLVSWNTCVETRRCLASLDTAVNDGLRYELIAVDNDSQDGSVDLLESWPGLRLIRNSANVGYAAAVNRAYQQARGEFILLLNSDICFQPGALSALVAFLREHGDAAGVVPLYLENGLAGALGHHYCDLLDLRSALALNPLLGRLPGFRSALKQHTMHGVDFSRPRPVPRPAAACLLLRRRLLGEHQIFDERLPLFCNDALLAQQLASQGHRLWMTPESVVTHLFGASTRLLDPTARSRHHIGSFVRYLRLTEPRRSLVIYQSVVLADRLIRRLFRLPGHLPVRDLIAAVRGDLGPLPLAAPAIREKDQNSESTENTDHQFRVTNR
ncbi:glycosyltransferase family 2 protein [Actinopolymorpha alba]|uniref:glycosyltransferase family 2 protein n=1 Tax=Actinopolymorpha alba TaxID=533267 RepID=UPI00047774D3|nr:glycosyltransferase [Actinopolymorpha alba]